jgi:hypothetical protein
MQCNEPAFEQAIQSLNIAENLRYLEIGCAYGVTANAIAHRLEQVRPGRWQVVMLDKANGGWAYNKDACKAGAGELWGGMITSGMDLKALPNGKVFLNDGGSEEFIWANHNMFDIVLIDGCHSRSCCAQDFVGISFSVNPGGFVFFHDADPFAQGQDVQPHCNKPIGVRQALFDYGLMDGSRKGWKVIADIQPEDTKNQRGCVVIRKIEA